MLIPLTHFARWIIRCGAIRLDLSLAINALPHRVSQFSGVNSKTSFIIMHNTPVSDSRSPLQSGGVITRAQAGASNDTAQPSLTSGFGSVLEKEHDLQTATEGSFGHVRGNRTAEIDRILHHQHSRLGANIALLEQRYEALPKSERFVSWRDRTRTPTKPRHMRCDANKVLPDLIAQHTSLLASIDALIGCAPDGQRGELILTEVGRNHEEMARMLASLLKEDESAKHIAHDRSGERSQENWDNEGGPARTDSPSI
jgi:hypothetical protein